jgi:hypothetical protein
VADLVPDLKVDGAKKALSAVLFMQAGMYTLDSYSTLNSSPWTAESFGGDPDKLASLKEYVAHAAVYSTAYCLVSAYIGGSPWPIYGSIVNNAYLVWLYNRAVVRARSKGSSGWS